jgi:hypothetical protein
MFIILITREGITMAHSIWPTYDEAYATAVQHGLEQFSIYTYNEKGEEYTRYLLGVLDPRD